MTVQYRWRGRTAAEITDDIEQAVRRGDLRPGDRLPSVRALAAELHVSASTAAAALGELRRRGVIVTRDRDGSRINDKPPLAAPLPAVVVPAGVRDLATGNPDATLLPPLASALAEVAKRTTTPRLYGEDPIVAELVRFVLRDLIPAADGRLGHQGHSDVGGAVVGGALDGIERALLATVPPGAPVAVEDPGYDSLLGLVRALGHTPVPLHLDEHGIRADGLRRALRDGARAVILTSRAQNPTGAALTADRAEELRVHLSEHPDVVLIENDHLGAVSGAPLVSLAGSVQRWAYVRSFAKSLGPDLRAAVLLGDPLSIDRVSGRQALGPGWVSTLLQRTALALLTGADTGLLIEEAARAYTSRRDALLAALAHHGVKATGASGFNIWVPVPDETTAAAALLAAGWAVAPGARYRLISPPGVRITIADLAVDEAGRLAEALRQAVLPGTRRTA